MATTAGIWNHVIPSDSVLGSAQPAAASTTPTPADGTTISSNDFLTLLVTEMQNQDPTANTDPNQYVNQLVQVNSLEQLININQTLSDRLATPVATPTPKAIGSAPSPSDVNSGKVARAPIPVTAHATHITNGNLAVPDANPAAQRVSQALSHHTHLL